MRATTVSVVIPTRNRVPLLRLALDSVRRQRFPHLEVLVVNDGEDAPHDAVRESGLRARVLRPAMRGAVAARNAAVRAATGDVIACLDDDDRWEDGHLDRLLAALDHAPFAHADGLIEVHEGDRGMERIVERVRFGLDATPDVLARTNPILMSGCAYRRSLHGELGLYDPGLPRYHDWDWHRRVAARYPLARVPEVGVRIRVGVEGGSASDPRDPAVAEDLRRFCRKHGLGVLPQHTFLSALRDPALGLGASSLEGPSPDRAVRLP